MIKPFYSDPSVVIYHGDARELTTYVASMQPVNAFITDPVYEDQPYDVYAQMLALTSGPVISFGSAPMMARDLQHFPLDPDRILIWAPKFTLSHTMKYGIAYRYHPIYTWRLPQKHDGPIWDVIDIPTERITSTQRKRGQRSVFWEHAWTKPLALMRLLVQIVPEHALIVDNFCGTGTTLRAAKDTGRRAVGIECDERACEIAALRMSQEVLPGV